MRNIGITLCDSQYNRNKWEQHFLSAVSVSALIEKPLTSDAKLNAGYMLPYAFKSGTPALKENCVSQTCLMLDIDDTATIEEVTTDIREYEYYLYTTHSHKATNHKFRVIMPLLNYIPFEFVDTLEYKEALMSRFPYNDRNSVKVQGFYRPNRRAGGEYIHIKNDGKRFSLMSIIAEADKLKKGNDRNRRIYNSLIRSMGPKGDGKGKASTRPAVIEYLNSPDSDSGQDAIAFKALCTAIGCNDNDALYDVKEKMRRDKYSEKEIDYKVKCALR